MSEQHLRNSSRSGLSAAPHAALEDPAPDLTKTGLNPLYGSAIVGGTPPTQAMQAPAPPKGQDGEAGKSNKKKGKSQSGEGREARRGEAPKVRRTVSSQRKRPSARGGSPQSILTTSTSQSPSSSSSRHVRPTGPSPPQAAPAERSRSRSNTPPTRRQSEAAQDSAPAPLVPALLCPVPPPPRKRKVRGDIETGGGAGAAAEGEEGTVLEDAPDKTLMEVLQKYLKKQDLYTRIVLVVILLLLAGGVLGAYGAMLTLAIQDKNTKYIVLASLFSLILFWVLWKYCFSGDQKLQDQSQIAQDIATLYAAIPDHTAVRGVSEKGRAQFTDFKYEKSEMMFTAVTDDGVSLGSERGSELMMDGADPSCPLCNIAYVEGADLCLLPCLHVFHKHCINKWCNRHIVCPLCKRHLEAPEPLHTLTATSGSTHGAAAGMARSEPGGGHHNHHQQHHHHGARGAVDSRGTWRQMLGTAAPGPLSGHGSERGLGGTRSEDGRWNDRVLNAAQQQMDGCRQNRVTSFSSETRRANSARGRAGERGPAGRGLGPPQSSSAGASALRGPQRAQSVSGSVGGRHHRIQRKRSSSFNTGSERRGSGRVAHGTAPHRGGGGGGSFRGPDSNSPRARSDLGVGSRDADRIRANTDAMLSRHASRRNNGAGGTKVLTKPMFGEDGAGAWASSSGKGKGKGKGKAKRGGGGGGEGGGEASGSSQQGGGGRGPAVITVRKVKTVGAGAGAGAGGAEAGGASKKKQPGRRTRTVSAAAVGGAVGGGVGDFARSGGESESDFGGERVFTTNSSRHNHYDDDLSPDEVTTKALTYGPRKSQVSRENSASKESSGGHRRQWSTGSTSADEVGSGKKSRRRSASGSKSGSGNHMLIAGAAATAEAVSKLLGRPSEDRSAYSVSSSRGGVGGARVSAGAENSEASSGGESGSDGRAEGGSDRRSRRNSARLSGSRRGSQLQQHRTTPPKTGPVTKGTPAPPMAAARVATWNSSSSAPAPVFDASLPHSMSDAEHQHQHQLQRAYAGDGRGRDGAGGGPSEVMVGASSVEATSSSPMETPVKGTPSRGWGFRIPTSAGSAEFFGLGVGSHGSANGSSISHGNGTSNGHGNSCASAEAADGEHSDSGGFAAGPSLTSKVFSRSSGPSRRGGGAVSGVRLFGSGAASTSSRTGPAPVRGGNSAFALDSENSPPGGRIDLTASSSVQELIQTYEKSRSSSDEKGAHSDDWSARAPVTSEGKKRNSKTFTRRRGSGASAASMNELAATESELDDDQIDRPKLTYKRKGSRHGHSRSRTPSEGEAMARAAMYGSASEGGLDLSEGHGHHPNGDDWADEEPFHRPKLSYGGGLRSSSRRSSTGSESGRRSST